MEHYMNTRLTLRAVHLRVLMLRLMGCIGALHTDSIT